MLGSVWRLNPELSGVGRRRAHFWGKDWDQFPRHNYLTDTHLRYFQTVGSITAEEVYTGTTLATDVSVVQCLLKGAEEGRGLPGGDTPTLGRKNTRQLPVECSGYLGGHSRGRGCHFTP